MKIELRWKELPIDKTNPNCIVIDGQMVNKYLLLQYREIVGENLDVEMTWKDVPIQKPSEQE